MKIRGGRLSVGGCIILVILNAMIVARAQKLELVPYDKLPQSGTFWSLQLTNPPPWPLFPPWLREMETPVYVLDDARAVFLVDDSAVDYQAIYAQREKEKAELRLAWEAGLLSDEEYWTLEGGGPAMMMSTASSALAYGNPVFLVDPVASTDGSQTTASFSIAGGTNNVPYDILMATNIADSLSQWKWLGIG